MKKVDSGDHFEPFGHKGVDSFPVIRMEGGTLQNIQVTASTESVYFTSHH